MFGAVLNRLATSVRRALSKYAVGTQEPELAFDFIDNEYITNNSTSNFASAITHSRSGNATMTDGYGPELVTNGGFDSDSDWTKGTGWSIVDGKARSDGSQSSFSDLVQSVSTTSGVTYIGEVKVKDRTAGTLTGFAFDGATLGTTNAQSSDGTYTFVFEAVSSSTSIYMRGNVDFVGTIDNVSVREMPVLKWAPHNLALYSEQFDQSWWSKLRASVTANQIVAPDGTTTADEVIEDTASGTHGLVRGSLGITDATMAVFAKQNTRSSIRVIDQSGNGASFDLSDGTVISTTSNFTSSITAVGNDWYLCSVSGTFVDNGIVIGLLNDSDLSSYTGDGSSSAYFWGAHIFRSDLGGMVDNPDRGDSYVPTAGRPVGANLVLNGTFDTDSDWTKGTGWTISGGKANHAAGTASQLTSTDSSLLNGEVYEVRLTVSNRTAGSLLLEGAVWTSAETISANGDYVFYKVKSGDGPAIFYGSGTFDGSIDDITVRKSTVNPATAAYLPRIGHHVYNGSAWVNEGLLAESEARTNVATYSNFSSGFGNTRCTRTPDAAVSPDGTQNASEVIETTDTGTHFISTNTTVTASVAYTLSCYFKQSSGSRSAILRTNNVGTTTYAVLDFATGTITETGADARNATVEDVGNGWYRVAFTYTQNATTLSGIIVSLSNSTTPSSSAPSYTGDGTSGIYIYGVQFEQAETPSSYVPTGAGSSVTRAAETFTIPSANLPWPSPNYIGSDLVTNGTFDTDLSGWSIPAGSTSTVSYSSGVMSCVRNNEQVVETTLSAQIIAGKVYAITYTVSNSSNPSAGYVYPSFSGQAVPNNTSFKGNKTHTAFFVAITNTSNFRINAGGVGGLTFDIDNISVREINPLSVSIAMDGRMTFADTDNSNEALFYRWFNDLDNRIQAYLTTGGANTGSQVFYQEASNVADFVSTGSDHYTPGVLTAFDIASRHGSTFINGANEGVALTANTTPTALADLSATDLELAYDYMGTIGTFRVWDKDLGDTGLVEATNPSLEPSLSLTFEGAGTNSFVVNDWSE